MSREGREDEMMDGSGGHFDRDLEPEGGEAGMVARLQAATMCANELGQLRGEVASLSDKCVMYDIQLTAARAVEKGLADLLRKYGDHTENCVPLVQGSCRCGWNDLKKKLDDGGTHEL